MWLHCTQALRSLSQRMVKTPSQSIKVEEATVSQFQARSRKTQNLHLGRELVSGSFLSAFGQVTLFAALSFAPTIYVVPTYNLKSIVTVLLAYAVIPKSERISKRAILGAVLAIGGIVLINL